MLSSTPVIILSPHLFIIDDLLSITGRHLFIIEHIDRLSFIILYRLHVITDIGHIIKLPIGAASHILERMADTGMRGEGRGFRFVSRSTGLAG